jgi:cysteine desulfurase
MDQINPDTYYFDNAATTIVRKSVIKAYIMTSMNTYANPSSLHRMGVDARNILEWARNRHATLLNIKSETLYFTSSGTESNNIAIRSVWMKMVRDSGGRRKKIVVSSVEHPSVTGTAHLVATNENVIHVPVDSRGYIDMKKYNEIIKTNSKSIALVSIILAQNEIGTLQSIPSLVGVLRKHCGNEVPFHTDATQAIGKYIIHPVSLGVDLLTGSAHKYHGPKGVGLLYARSGLLDPKLTPISGGGQELGCRSGTENVPAIVGSAIALQTMLGDRELMVERRVYIKRLRDYLLNTLKTKIPDLEINGDPENGLYNLLNVTIPSTQGKNLQNILASKGIIVGSGSACSKGKPSLTLIAIGQPVTTMTSTIRISLSEFNTVKQINTLIAEIINLYKR